MFKQKCLFVTSVKGIAFAYDTIESIKIKCVDLNNQMKGSRFNCEQIRY